MNSIIKKAVDTFGEEIQSVVAMEELAELTQAISKIRRAKFFNKGFDKSNIQEEIADVLIITDQLVYMYDLDAREIGDIAEKKLQALEKFIDENKE